MVPGAASLQFSLTGHPLPAQVWSVPSATAVPGPNMAMASIEATAIQPSFLIPNIPAGRFRRRVYIDRSPS
jgi:hypothetical protein